MLLQVAELKKRLGSQSQFSTQRKKADESTKQLQFEIQNLKAQKVTFLLGWTLFTTALVFGCPSPALGINLCVYIQVQLQCKIKLESVQFRLCKALLEKEVLQVYIQHSLASKI